MVGILLVAVGELFSEIGLSIGKYEAARKKESVYALGFLNAFWATIFLLAIGFVRPEGFVFSTASLPTFSFRIVLEILLMFITIHAVLAADRSTFSFLRTLTIPLLLVVDIALGYTITMAHITGIAVVSVVIVFLSMNRGLSRKGKLLSLLSALLAVGTISLYKYDITHFNSVAAEQGLTHLALLTALIVGARVQGGENVFRYLGNPLFLGQSVASGIASVCINFAYLYAPASLITAAKRSFEVMAGVLAGRAYFHEKHLGTKLAACGMITLGIACILS